ncbi:uncharacterized protein LOC113291689 [Papaver somniferum]|uniref:uncharacterized protein LOC113291689 n=1 Tax=Papaver somniferum TaxID=3469 RepID=UPI000E6FFDAE|nr:uncharacterized protein LOC113291689 [Papaver somniferum]
MEFFKAVWDIIKEDLMLVIKEFEHSGTLDWRLNCTNIILIPKCEGDVNMNDFRPISLVGGVYKIIIKLLADRLKVVLPTIISDFQGAFVDNRQITDGNLITSEIIDSRERDNNPGLVVKVDFQKAFDSINWGCLDYALSRFGFGTKAATLDLISGFRPAHDAAAVNHLQFADDLIFFLEDKVEQIVNLKNILLAFELISGMKVNFKKSAIVAVGPAQSAADSAISFGCQLAAFPMKYLGIPLGSKSKSVGVWEKKMDKIMRYFLWGSSNKKTKKSWVGWRNVNLPKEGGGVGIKKLRLMNKALHAKWVWRYGVEDKALWRNIMNQKFGGNPKAFFPNSTTNVVGKRLWTRILKSSSHVLNSTALHINSGDKCLFWKDQWANGYSLKNLFPALYKISRSKDATLQDL